MKLYRTLVTSLLACACVMLIALHAIVLAKNLSPNVLSVLDSSFLTTQKIGFHDGKPDISYLFADLKFDGRSLKICEFGQSTKAGRPLSKVIINGQEEPLTSPYWGIFWHYLKELGVPVWCVGDQEKIEISELVRTQGHCTKRLAALRKDPLFKNCTKKNIVSRSKITDFAGIVVLAYNSNPDRVRLFKNRYPSILFVNDRLGTFASNKNLMNPLFARLGLADYKSRCGLYSKKYSPELTQKIKDDLKADFFIIKPINSQQSRGVLMVQEQDLDDTLQLILNDSQSLQTADHRSLQYWSDDKNDPFIVEEYAPSKTIIVNKKQYDPTMRLVFCLRYEQGLMTIHVLGGFWKIPLKSLHEPGSLTEQHVTIPFSGDQYVGIPIEHDDMRVAKGLLATMLVPLYSHLLDLTE